MLKEFLWDLLYLICFSIFVYIITLIYGVNKINMNYLYFGIGILLLSLIIYFIVKRFIKHRNKIVTSNSLKIQSLIKLNDEYSFKSINKKHFIFEREFSRKSLERVTGKSIIKYHIENNIDSLRTDIESAIDNINKLDNYNNDITKIMSIVSKNETKYSNKKFKKIEDRIFNSLIYKKEDFFVNLKLEVNYKSTGGKVDESRYGKYSFMDLCEIYNEWNNGNKYEETKKQERKIMNDGIRYNVLKRDNYTCQICGKNSKDGVKLHVDHIIPVAKGGKTVMSNLQTLCDRCNIGKSDKTNEYESDICPMCGGRLVRRKGKYGTFFGCSNYPKCTYIKK